jgi:hypothetical protein
VRGNFDRQFRGARRVLFPRGVSLAVNVSARGSQQCICLGLRVFQRGFRDCVRRHLGFGKNGVAFGCKTRADLGDLGQPASAFACAVLPSSSMACAASCRRVMAPATGRQNTRLSSQTRIRTLMA